MEIQKNEQMEERKEKKYSRERIQISSLCSHLCAALSLEHQLTEMRKLNYMYTRLCSHKKYLKSYYRLIIEIS